VKFVQLKSVSNSANNLLGLRVSLRFARLAGDQTVFMGRSTALTSTQRSGDLAARTGRHHLHLQRHFIPRHQQLTAGCPPTSNDVSAALQRVAAAASGLS